MEEILWYRNCKKRASDVTGTRDEQFPFGSDEGTICRIINGDDDPLR
jgi:hypothetical protein